ncbi:hypothetical protein [Vulcanisaeta distributa]|nr:hypothetical protein [Vulcanisaeta distributa]
MIDEAYYVLNSLLAELMVMGLRRLSWASGGSQARSVRYLEECLMMY